MAEFRTYIAIRSALTSDSLYISQSNLLKITNYSKQRQTKILKNLENKKYIKIIKSQKTKNTNIIYKLKDPKIHEKLDKTISKLYPNQIINLDAKNLRKYLYEKYLKENYNNTPITRQKIKNITNLDKKTQKIYENTKNIKKYQSYIKVAQDKDNLTEKERIEFKKRKYSIFPEGEVMMQIGNIYVTDGADLTKPSRKMKAPILSMVDGEVIRNEYMTINPFTKQRIKTDTEVENEQKNEEMEFIKALKDELYNAPKTPSFQEMLQNYRLQQQVLEDFKKSQEVKVESVKSHVKIPYTVTLPPFEKFYNIAVSRLTGDRVVNTFNYYQGEYIDYPFPEFYFYWKQCIQEEKDLQVEKWWKDGDFDF